MLNQIKNKSKEVLPNLIKDIKTICNIDSRIDSPLDDYPYGKKVADCLDSTLKLASLLGFEVENFNNEVGVVSFGPKTKDYIAIVGHLDVVDVDDKWSTNPFECVEKDGTLFARGVLDNKGPTLTCLYALKILKDLNYNFPIQIKILLGTDEESGMRDMINYFKCHDYPKMGFTPDCKYPVIYAERGRAVFNIYVDKSDKDVLDGYFNTYIKDKEDLSKSLGVNYTSKEFGINQVRKVEQYEEGNIVGLKMTMSYPADYSLESMEESLKKTLNEKMNIKLESNIDPVFFDKDSYLIKTLEKVYEEVMNDDGKAVTTTGGTYAKVIKNIVPFGPSFKGQKGIGHLPNEWMNISDIEKNLIIYTYALYKLSKDIK